MKLVGQKLAKMFLSYTRLTWYQGICESTPPAPYKWRYLKLAWFPEVSCEGDFDGWWPWTNNMLLPQVVYFLLLSGIHFVHFLSFAELTLSVSRSSGVDTLKKLKRGLTMLDLMWEDLVPSWGLGTSCTKQMLEKIFRRRGLPFGLVFQLTPRNAGMFLGRVRAIRLMLQEEVKEASRFGFKSKHAVGGLKRQTLLAPKIEACLRAGTSSSRITFFCLSDFEALNDQWWYQVYRKNHPNEIFLDTECKITCTFYGLEEDLGSGKGISKMERKPQAFWDFLDVACVFFPHASLWDRFPGQNLFRDVEFKNIQKHTDCIISMTFYGRISDRQDQFRQGRIHVPWFRQDLQKEEGLNEKQRPKPTFGQLKDDAKVVRCNNLWVSLGSKATDSSWSIHPRVMFRR